jgi:isopentenyldiphosphate isomerase
MSLMDDPEELLDLVDKNDQVIGVIVREDIPKLLSGDLAGMVRAISVFIMNDAGKLWVPTRGPHKKIAPNGLDFSAGEHVMSGESYTQAAVRGMREELGLNVAEADLGYIGTVSNEPVGLPYFNALFVYHDNRVPDYNKDDFVSFSWLTPAEVLAQLARGVPAKKDMKLTLELLQQHKQG